MQWQFVSKVYSWNCTQHSSRHLDSIAFVQAEGVSLFRALVGFVCVGNSSVNMQIDRSFFCGVLRGF